MQAGAVSSASTGAYRAPRSRPIRSSFPLQAVISFNQTWSAFFFFVALMVLIYKGWALPDYPHLRYTGDILWLVVYFFADRGRLLVGTAGNKTENTKPMVGFLLLTALIAFSNLGFMYWQVYVLRVDQIINMISLVFAGVEFVLALAAMVTFLR